VKGILIIAPAFPPVPGELSSSIEALCVELAKRGYAVSVATWDAAGRIPSPCPGVHIVGLRREGEVDGLPAWVAVIRRLLASQLFSTCILFAHPRDLLPWAFINARAPATTRLIVRLQIDGFEALQTLKEASLRQRMNGILRQSSVNLILTRSGPDRRFLDAEGIPGMYLPPATVEIRSTRDFRARYGIPSDAFVVLMPGDICMAKYQLGLIQALRGSLAGTVVVFAASSRPGGGEPHIEKQFAEAISVRADFLYLPGLDRDSLSAAFAESDVVAFASPFDYVPRELILAMAHAKPWIAVEECAVAHDCVGGFRTPLTNFREALCALQKNPELLSRMGAAGRRHWQQCFSWDAVMPAWTDLIDCGATDRSFAIPDDLVREQEHFECALNAAVEQARASFLNAFDTKPRGLSFCIITDGGEPDKLRREIESIRSQGIAESEILLGGAIPEGFDDVQCIAMADAARNGRLGFMRNRLVERTRFAVIVVADDDMIFHEGFARSVLAYSDDYDVLCVRIENTDGTRFWDWAVYGSPTGHHLIPYETQDPFVYVTGGMCVMRSHVPELVKWSDSLGFYQFEDIDFSRKLNEAGLRIRCCRQSVVTHNDDRYYGNNYQVAKRTGSPSHV
jgi:glycosyltransferase involved in cell wall biosynthesis